MNKLKTFVVLLPAFITGIIIFGRIFEGESEEYKQKITQKLLSKGYNNIRLIDHMGICPWPRDYNYGIETSVIAKKDNKEIKFSVCDDGDNLAIQHTL